MTSSHSLRVQGLGKVFASADGPVKALDDVSFDISGDDFFTMLGPSGCGKTTTLRLIAGLETPTGGRILFDNRDIASFSALQRGIGMVFQSYALFPHMTVFENVAYGLRLRNTDEAHLSTKVTELLEMLGLRSLSGRHPADLSGGQQQRVAIARALVYDPTMLLLDEPLANLDAKLRIQMREEIRRIQKSLGIMTLYVTHDQEEAMSISDRIGVFNLGRLMQFGTPQEIYTDPRSLFVADFVGKANFLKAAAISATGSGASAGIAGLGEITVSRVHKLDSIESAEIKSVAAGLIMIRPEHLEIAAGSGTGLPCRIRRIQFLGSFVRYMAECDAARGEITVDSRRPIPGAVEGGEAHLRFSPNDAILFLPDGHS
jgi:iron(III) transport system ATP-binding protein